MTRYARRLGLQDKLKVIVVARTWEDLPYAAELQRYGAFIALTRENLAIEGGRPVAAPPYPSEVEVVRRRRPSGPTSAGRSGSRRTPPGCSGNPESAATRSGSSSSGETG